MQTNLISGALGAEINGINLKDSSKKNCIKINKLLLEHKVLFFRNQDISAEEQITQTDEFGPDLQQNASFSFVRQSLVDISYVVEVGDIIDWNSGYWEITSTNESQLVGGKTDYKHSVVCNAFLVRISNLNIERVRSV